MPVQTTKRSLAHTLSLRERFEQASRESSPPAPIEAICVDIHQLMHASAPRKRRWTGWPEPNKAKRSNPPLPLPQKAPSKLYTPAKMARAAVKTRTIDAMFSSACQKLRQGAIAENSVDLIAIEEQEHDTSPIPAPVQAALRPRPSTPQSRKAPDCVPDRRKKRFTRDASLRGTKPKQTAEELNTIREASSKLTPLFEGLETLPVVPSPEASVNCKCGKIFDDPRGTIRCTSPACKYGTWHKGCGGKGIEFLKNHHSPSRWMCPECRIARQAMPISISWQFSSASIPRSTAASHMTFALEAPEPALHPEQAMVVDAILGSRNVFCTGPGGTGKSTILRVAVKRLRARGKRVDILAPTGIAALAIGGCTIFHYAGWFPGSFKLGKAALIKKALVDSVRRRLCSSDVIFIDEVSMVENDVLHMLDMIMRDARAEWQPADNTRSLHEKNLPFGGCQIVITGDFCQLPPVKPFQTCLDCGGDELKEVKNMDRICNSCKCVYKDKDKWAFESTVCKSAGLQCFELKHIHRQRDAQLITILQKWRSGTPLLQSEIDSLQKQKVNMEDAVKLLPTKREASDLNEKCLRLLHGSLRTYRCWDDFDWRNHEERELRAKCDRLSPGGPLKALKDHRFDPQIELKVGSLVILLVNLDLQTGLVNGSQGRVVGFERSDLCAHKSSNNKISEIAAFKEAQICRFMSTNCVKEWPVVLWSNGVRRTITPFCAFDELGSRKPFSKLSRTMIPLVSAWAITIHKSQGMTLDKVEVDLRRSFEREQGYVALSRARSSEGLWAGHATVVERWGFVKGSHQGRDVAEDCNCLEEVLCSAALKTTIKKKKKNEKRMQRKAAEKLRGAIPAVTSVSDELIRQESSNHLLPADSNIRDGFELVFERRLEQPDHVVTITDDSFNTQSGTLSLSQHSELEGADMESSQGCRPILNTVSRASTKDQAVPRLNVKPHGTASGVRKLKQAVKHEHRLYGRPAPVISHDSPKAKASVQLARERCLMSPAKQWSPAGARMCEGKDSACSRSVRLESSKAAVACQRANELQPIGPVTWLVQGGGVLLR